MKLLKQSTAVTVSFGPFTDATDGVTLETGLVSALDHVSTGIKLSKNGAALAVRNLGAAGSPTGVTTPSTYDANGNYRVTLDTTDTATLGRLRMQYTDSATCLPVWDDFMVVPANVYDAFVSGTDNLKTDAVEFDSDTDAAANARRLSRSTVIGTVAAGSTTTSVKVAGLNVAVGAADQFKGLILAFDMATSTAALRGQKTDISASSAAGSPEVVTLTVTALTSAPVVGDLIVIS